MLLSTLLLALPFVAAAPSPWQADDSPVHALFKRQQASGAAAAPAPGASGSKYPAELQVPKQSPKEWTDKLKSVQIADVPVAQKDPASDNAVIYPGNPSMDELSDAKGRYCAYSTGCMREGDIRDLPEGVFGLTFDDGPGEGTQLLSDFLESKQMSSHATHFFIGGNTAANKTAFDLVFNRGGQIAAHTWSHPRMTTLTNEEVVAEIGWSLQVIYDYSGGRIPAYWRPPYGDVDNRVRDIATKVFGVKTVLWNSDTNDWKIPTEGKGPVEQIFDQWATGPKTVGHNTLMHEIRTATVEVFISKYDTIVNNGWKIQSIAEATNGDMYLNAKDNKAPVTQMSIAAGGGSTQNSTSSGGASGSASGSSAPSGTKSGSSATPSSSSAAGRAVPGVAVLLAAAAAYLL